MFEHYMIELDKLIELKSAIEYELTDLDKHITAIRLYGAPLVWVNRQTKHLLSNPLELHALATIKRQKGKRPRFVSDSWSVPTIFGDWTEADEKRQALRLIGGVGGLLLPTPYAESLLPILTEYNESTWSDARAIGLDTDELLYMLDMLADDSPPAAPEPPVNASWGVPELDLALQGVSISQAVKWGTMARKTALPGCTVHFYTDDSKFSALSSEPARLLETQCESVIEVNFSTAYNMPRALVLGDIFQKRTLARYWQDNGVRVFVDLNVNREFFDLALLGVPPGWTAYANRAYAKDLEHLARAYDLARAHADQEITYVIYGGGKKARALCSERGWQWIPDHTHEVHNGQA